MEEQEKENKKYFEKLFYEYADVIFRLCLYKTSDENTAYDLTQETFLRLWKMILVGKEIDKPKQYLYQIARNLIKDHYGSKKSVSLDLLQIDGFDPKTEDSSPELVAEVMLLKGVIESLDKEFRQVAYLRLVEEMKVKEIAELLGISENLVSVRINRAKKKINEIFK